MGLKRSLIFLFLTVAVPFAQPLLFGAAILDDDIFLQSLPAWEWLSRNIRSGESILWSPEMMGGFPLAFTQYPFLYPPDLLLAWLLPPAQAYAWSLVLHIWLSGALTYLYCRLLGLKPQASLLAAVSYQLSSEVVAGASGFTARSAYILPGLILAVELIAQKGTFFCPLLTLVIAAALLGGHAQFVLFGLGAGAAYGAFRLTIVAHEGGVHRAATLMGSILLAALLGVAVASVRLLPTWEVVALSTRADGLPAEAVSTGSLSLQGLLAGYFLPLTRLQTVHWGSPGYAGPAVVTLAVLGVRWATSHRFGSFFLTLAILSAILSMGDLTPLGAFLDLPLLSFFRETSRLTLVTTFCLCIVGGVILDGFGYQRKSNGRRIATPFMALGILVVSAIAGFFVLGYVFQFGTGPAVEDFRTWVQDRSLDALNPLRPRMALCLLGTVVSALAIVMAIRGRLHQGDLEKLLIATSVGVLVPLAAILNPTIAPEVIGAKPDIASFLEEQRVSGRIFSHRPGTRLYNHMHYYGPSQEAGVTDDLRYRFQAGMLAPMLNYRWGIPSADGYEQLHSRWQELLFRYIDSERVTDWFSVPGKWADRTMEQRLRVLRMLGVQYIISATDLSMEAPVLKKVAEFEIGPGPISRGAAPVIVLEHPDALPRYYLVSSAITFDTDTELLDAVADGEAEPASAALFSQESGVMLDNVPARSYSDTTPGEVRIESSRNSEVALKVSTDRPAFLVTNDAYWPGWVAFLDGREVDILRANVSGRAVWVPESGVHEIVFKFLPKGFESSRVVSMLASFILIIWAGYLMVHPPKVHRTFGWRNRCVS